MTETELSTDRQSTYWPYATEPERADTEGPWKMGMSAGGSMVIWPSNKPFPASLHLIEAFQGTKEQLEKFHGTFCRFGYEKDKLHKYQDTNVWLFNWTSGTLAQIRIAGQVAKKYFDGEYNEAWEVGRAFRDAIQEAENGAAVDGQARATGVAK